MTKKTITPTELIQDLALIGANIKDYTVEDMEVIYNSVAQLKEDIEDNVKSEVKMEVINAKVD